MMNKEKLPHIVTAVSFVVFIVLGLACATGPTVQVDLDAKYQKYLQPPSGNERSFDQISLRGVSFQCRDGSHSVTRDQELGAPYGVAVPKKGKDDTTEAPAQKHKHEPIFDQLLREAEKQYPNETVDMRSAKTARHYPTNPRQEEYTTTAANGTAVKAVRTVWTCFPVYVADVITTTPWPQPVVVSDKFTRPGSTRADIYRWAINWLEDKANMKKRGITIYNQNMDRGRITGEVVCSAQTDRTYIVRSEFTIDVYDARVELSFDEAVLQRIDTEGKRGDSERIFLQSIADAAQAELNDFCTTLKSAVLSR